MRIAFVGKGGSGKTTISSLFAQFVASQGATVLALDADINQHLADALEVKEALPSMGDGLPAIKQHLVGANTRFTAATMHKTTPPGHGSRFVSLDQSDWFMQAFTRRSNGVAVGGAGVIPEENIGVKCYHGLNGAVELVLGHMLDKKDEYVVVDMTAGADAFSSSLFAKVDVIVLVAEPTLKSLSVYKQFKDNLKGFAIPLLVVANKIADDDDLAFVTQHVGAIQVVIPPSSYVKRRERGEVLGVDAIDPPLRAALEKLQESVDATERDWHALEQRSHVMHRKNADSWMGVEVKDHIDTAFSLHDYATKVLDS